MGKKRDLSDFERGMVADARRTGLRIKAVLKAKEGPTRY